MSTIPDNIAKVRTRIREAEQAGGRAAGSVQLLAVSKTKPPAALREAFACGQRDFGENYLQEALSKQAALADLPLTWHFIGRIQRNKTRDLAKSFDWVHTIDRPEIAQRLSAQRPPELGPLQCLIEVNVSGEASKGGVSPADLPALAQLVATLDGLQLRGLMCLPAPAEDFAAQRVAFRQLRQLRDGLNLPGLDVLSMGTSADFAAAIAEGATLVRIGTALFGAREPEAAKVQGVTLQNVFERQESAEMSDTLAFIGAGNMGRAIIGGLVQGGLPATQIRVADADPAAVSRLAETQGTVSCANNLEAVSGASVVVLAVKPQQMRSVVTELAPALAASRPLVLSIAAGITTQALAQWLGGEAAIVRSMPNTPALIRQGTSALFANPAVSSAQRRLAGTVMGAVGRVHWLEDESLMDAVTALSGSGPAYIFRVIEALEEAGTALGLPPALARALALETTAGAGALAAGSTFAPGELRAQVTSRGGTTERALAVLNEGGLAELFAQALVAARDRSRSLAEEFGQP